MPSNPRSSGSLGCQASVSTPAATRQYADPDGGTPARPPQHARRSSTPSRPSSAIDLSRPQHAENSQCADQGECACEIHAGRDQGYAEGVGV